MATRRGPDNSVRVAIKGLYGSQNWANVFHCQLTTSSSIIQADLDTWTTSFQAQFKTSFAPRQSTGVSYVSATTTLYSPGGGVITSVIAMTGAGTNAGAIVNDNSASAVISWLSTVYWRGGKPRTYLQSVISGDLSNSFEFGATAITNYTTAATGFRTAINALTAGTITGTQLGFVSFSTGNVPRTPAVFFPITGARVHPRIGTQRRRLGKWLN